MSGKYRKKEDRKERNTGIHECIERKKAEITERQEFVGSTEESK